MCLLLVQPVEPPCGKRCVACLPSGETDWKLGWKREGLVVSCINEGQREWGGLSCFWQRICLDFC